MDNPSNTGASSDVAKGTDSSAKAAEVAKPASTTTAQPASAAASPAVTEAFAAAMKAAGIADATVKPREVLSKAVSGRPWEQFAPVLKTAARGDARRLIEGAKDPLGTLTTAGYSPMLAAQLLRDLGRR